MHYVEDQAALVGYVQPPILVGPDFLGVLLEEVADESSDLDPERREVGAVDGQRLLDTLLGSQLDIVGGHGDLQSRLSER